LFVPAADPPHKQHEAKTPVHHRLRMLECAIQGNPRFSISRVDIDRPGPHYSVDMVRLIQKHFPEAELYFVMGSDSLRDLPHWSDPEALIGLCRLAVMRRPGDDVHPDMHAAVLPELAARVVMVDAPLIGISSTEIADRLRQGKSIRYLVPDTVLSYIQSHPIYGKTPS
jgi:nicotinate-nucleotide adenylyltransferase